ncbi:hypothetical protein FPV16_15010 [Methylobacterium sp. W2]|uniref:hypothetical protein n=1 Tax=Methylobacterium sp. W2 TaxID=2598107 RepID=UPI001D0C45BC|nr:hypothetical protein [Methylobacterium sp. W2]MCC0807524.1 hypothetical protein [Methylobacterium sp. W2]
MSPRAFLLWLDGFALEVVDGHPTAAQSVEVMAMLATVEREAKTWLQITFIPGGAVRTDEYTLRTDA